MEFNRNRPKLNRFGLLNSRGETVVETVVSFLVLMLALGAMTTLIVTANNMNKKAQERSNNIESEAMSAETGDISDVSASNAQMKITMDGETVTIPLKVKESETGMFKYFGAGY